MRILVVNDDGIRAPGIERLARFAAQLGEVWVVAPEKQSSGMSQKLTLFEEMLLRQETFPVSVCGAWSVGGTPADCVKIALDCLLDRLPDYVFSGINNGYNAGFDIAYSGTIGACFEAVMNGIPAIAFSAASEHDADCAERWLLPIARELIALGQGPGEIWNVNFPAGAAEDCKGILRERRIAPMQLYEGTYFLRPHRTGAEIVTQTGVPIGPGLAPEDSDIAALQMGYISVGRIKSPVM